MINVGRDDHLMQDNLLPALETGQLANAILDVADPEPLPPEHPFWSHDRIVIYPTRRQHGIDRISGQRGVGKHPPLRGRPAHDRPGRSDTGVPEGGQR